MLVKTATGTEGEFNAASNGKANAGLTLGIIGTALGALAGGALNGNGLLGNNTNTCTVTEKEYYNNTISDMKEFFNYAQGVSDRICALEQRVAVDETSIAKNFEIEQMYHQWEEKVAYEVNTFVFKK